MTRFTVYTSPARGHLYPLIPTLIELRSRGHLVSIRTLASEIGMLQQLGFEAAAIDPAIESRELDDWRATSSMARMQRVFETWADRAPVEVPDLASAISVTAPDVLLIDVNCWGAGAAAEASGLPWAQYSPYLLPIPSRGAPPFGPGLAPMTGVLGALRDTLVRAVADRTLKPMLDRLNQLRTELGVARLASPTNICHRAPLVLAYTAEPFEYPRASWPAAVRHVGPGLWEPPAVAPAWLETLKRPLVLVATSSEQQADRALIEVAFAALEGEDLEVVATCPSGDTAGIKVPVNGRLERFLPHGLVIERSRAVICHGGMGTTQKALAAGVPVLVVPFGRDQLEVARRVELAGAGVRLPASKLTTRALRTALHETFAKKPGAERIAEAFAGAGGPAGAAGALCDLAPPGNK